MIFETWNFILIGHFKQKEWKEQMQNIMHIYAY